MVYVPRPDWLDRFSGENTEWLLLTPGGGIKYCRARDQEEALVKALELGVRPEETHDIRPRVGRSDAELMPNSEFIQKLGQLTE